MSSVQELIELIINAGLLEDFISWLRSKGIDTSEPFKLEELDLALIKRYIAEKRLIDISEDYEFEHLEENVRKEIENVYDVDLRPTKPKKIRSKK
ncbi:MAG: hypothetical protein DRO15_01275 [Thermoprotei archaeon]|nr:MAG: hypothetical protein DRO15_01275 [Thermoprotei archaeon]